MTQGFKGLFKKGYRSMSKEIKVNQIHDEQDACEVIELAVEEIELLSKAFNLITDVLACRSGEAVTADPAEFPVPLVH